MDLKGFAAEFVGTFALCFVGIAAIEHFAGQPAEAAGSSLGLLGIALAHGLTIGCFVAATIHVSGAQFNPAVSIGLLITGKQDVKRAGFFIIAQVLGALLASLLLMVVGLSRSDIGAGTPALGELNGEPITVTGGLLVEVVLTFFLMFVIWGSAVSAKLGGVAGIFIGGAVTLDILAGGPLTGAAMNPARHLGPALVAGGDHLGAIWLYWVGPVVGAALAALVCHHFVYTEADEKTDAS